MNAAAGALHAALDARADPELLSLWLQVRLAEGETVGQPSELYEQRAAGVRDRATVLRDRLRGAGAADEGALLQRYLDHFDDVARLETLIGLGADPGLLGGLQDTVAAINTAALDARDHGRRAHAEARTEQTQANVVISLVGFSGAALAFFLIAGSITRPIVEVKNAALTVAQGDLDVRLARNRRDELGVLRDSFNHMIGGLQGATDQLRDGADKVTSTVARLSSSTSEVSAASSETSAAMTEAVATIENVKQSVRATTNRSKHVSDISHDAAGVADSGKSAAGKSILGIENIRKEMEDIAASIMALNEQGQAIAEIISTVNDLAERSNLLAVNAAIEASKAGDEGRGFVVVADEIKGLAEQSKRSTAEVRTILNKIQKDTAASVLAAERGRKAVEQGIRQATEAGASISTLRSAIGEVALEAGEISSAMQQVDASVNQVFTAMASVLAATQQNEGAIGDVDAAIKSLELTASELQVRAARYRGAVARQG
jgi:methyl-accepting chemotaxis protein